MQLSCFFVSDNTLVGRYDSDPESAKDLRHILAAGIDTKTRLGNSLDSGDDSFVLVLAVLQGDVQILLDTLPGDLVLLDLSFIDQDIRDSGLHLGNRDIDSIVLCGVCVADSCKHIRDRIVHCHVSILLRLDATNLLQVKQMYTNMITRKPS